MEIKKDFSRTRKYNNSNLQFAKVTPQAPELEEAVLGACMIESETFATVKQFLYTSECFYADAHQKIWKAITELDKAKKPIDLLTVSTQLRKNNHLELVGGAYYLSQLTQSVLTSANAHAHAAIIFECFLKREIIRLCASGINDAYNDDTDVFEILDSLKEIQTLTDALPTKAGYDICDIVPEVLEDIKLQQEKNTVLIGTDTGFEELNEMTSGFQKKQLIVIAARPSKGKTALLLALARNGTISNRVPKSDALIISLETDKKNLTKRVIANHLHIPYKNITEGTVSNIELNEIEQIQKNFRQLKIFISEILELTHICNFVKNHIKKNPNCKVVYIDYLQLVVVTELKNTIREVTVSHISRTFKLLAKELDITIVALCQMNRAVESRKGADKFPVLADLRESGAIEQDADIVMFIHHEELAETDSTGKPIKNIFLVVAKNRDGQIGNIKLNFVGEYQSWLDLNEFTGEREFKSMSEFNQTNKISNEPIQMPF